MRFLTGDNTKVSAEDWTNIQLAWFPVVESKTITQADEVTAQSIADYLQTNHVDQVVNNYLTKKNVYKHTPITFND